ncbi:hypothetical protein [Pedobacter sp. NJ-S-72]
MERPVDEAVWKDWLAKQGGKTGWRNRVERLVDETVWKDQLTKQGGKDWLTKLFGKTG